MQVSVEVKDVTGNLYLKTHVGDAEYGGKKVSVCSCLPGGGVLMDIDKKTYLLSVETVVTAVVDKLGEG